MEKITIQQIEQLRKEFRSYLAETHPTWSNNTVSLHYSDAFFAYNNNVGIDFWTCFIDNTTLKNARDKIRDFLASEKHSDRAEERAEGYLASMKYLKTFLDERHKNISKDWRGKAMRDTYLKTAFQNWMRRQKKANGEPYKSNSISAYTSALKNDTAKLNIENIPNDLFHITSVAEFDEVYPIITSAPNFKEIDAFNGNGAYSKGLVHYAKFLKDQEEPSSWIFQGNPKYYDVISAVNDLETITWAINQYPKQIKKEDKAYIWLSGSTGGIIAVGTILCDPKITQPNLDDPYNRSETLNKEPYLAVDIQIQSKLTDSIVKRTTLLADERTKRMEILTYPGATNFRVKKEEDTVIESIISGNYQRIAATTHTPAIVNDKKRYWMYAPGESSRLWEEFYNKGIMGIGWEELGNLTQYPTKDAMKTKMKEIYGMEYSYKNAGHATWQFANEIKIGDVIIVKKGLTKIIGRGIVTSDYTFDDSRQEYNHTRSVHWTHKGEWDHEGQIVLKTLTDITPYTDYYKKLENMFAEETDDQLPGEDEEIKYESYTAEDFLSEVYMNKERYHTLKSLLRKKKNLILLGAPGVGKTFAAERLAYSVMGEKDTSRVMMVQFHQSYSYEDFIMGYRPVENGFSLSKGPFYQFCKEAEPDDRPYFFIIDEINRGNLSKIFGELLMLIENDKRGKELRLLYSDEQFSVPENVYIIGMMNTADRSLAMMDYALRRRFAFFEFEPAFDNEVFKKYQIQIANAKFDRLIDTVVTLNEVIAEDASLGSGFRIGHSYFSSDHTIDDEWLSEVMEYELIPLIKEYWFDEPSKIEHWMSKLRGAIHD
ncbi:AAA family ATPase [Bacillus sp. V3B]|uniref:AAA family ATPase n=1 Tax=Bacillus sp. V3B TaxID=2804915 RepID=UPI00210CAC19|nr:AAA family ATPase [Bacillus sp. V3B]